MDPEVVGTRREGTRKAGFPVHGTVFAHAWRLGEAAPDRVLDPCRAVAAAEVEERCSWRLGADEE